MSREQAHELVELAGLEDQALRLRPLGKPATGTCHDCGRPVTGERRYCGPCLTRH